MAIEIEAKFLNVDHDVVRAKLQTAGAILEEPMRVMRRQLYDYPDRQLYAANHGRVRIRDEGSSITMTFKSGGDGNYPKEFETTIGSFLAAAEILEAIGLVSFSVQESKRETWRLDNVEVVLDIWPWLNSYIEIEGPSEPAIQMAARKLGFDWATAAFGSVDTAYRVQYPRMSAKDTVGDISNLSFDGVMPQWFIDRQ